MMSDGTLKDKLTKILDQDIFSIAPLSAAKDAEIFKVALVDGQEYVAKRADQGLDIEAKMLTTLSDAADIPIPDIHYTDPQLIVMQFIVSDWELSDTTQKQLGSYIGGLHRVSSETYGYDYDTSVAGLPQDNTPSENWADFFIHQRILPMAQRALAAEHIDKALMKKIEKLMKKTPTILGAGNPPSLIHGDLWTGNVLPYRGEIKAFLDPALYYADPEIELAYATMTHTIDQSFFAAYEKKITIRPGFFEERRDLYTLYPLLVQTNIFGSSYARKVKRVLDKFL